MYLHIGQGAVVRHESVIGIFDLDNTTSSHLTRSFLNGEEKAGRVVTLGDELPKSFVLASENGNNTVYLSQLSPATISKRAESNGLE